MYRGGRQGAPFKYNPSWFEIDDFWALVKEDWVQYDPNIGVGASQQFVDSLRNLKFVVVHQDIGHKKDRIKCFLIRIIFGTK
jgi:hypothetical protein